MYTINHDGKNFEIKTEADLHVVPTPALVATYNELTGKETKKFASRTKGIEQVAKLIIDVDAAPAEVPVKNTSTGRKSALNKLAVVHLTVDVNPKREGSQAAANFDKYEDGITVEELQRRGISLADIRWNLAKDFISLEDPANADS